MVVSCSLASFPGVDTDVDTPPGNQTRRKAVASLVARAVLGAVFISRVGPWLAAR
jgi:hypothetical protein